MLTEFGDYRFSFSYCILARLAIQIYTAQHLSFQEAHVQTGESDERREESRESRASEAESSARSASTTPEISSSDGSNLGQIEDSISVMRAEYVER